MGEVVKFETREMLRFGKLWRRFWNQLPPDQQDRALRHIKKVLANMRTAQHDHSTSKERGK